MITNLLQDLDKFHCRDKWKFCKNFINIREDRYGLTTIKDIDYFIDIGSCIGEVAYIAHKLLNPTKTIAIEPSLMTFQCLKKNIGHIPNIYLENKAIYNQSNTNLSLILNKKNIGQNTTVESKINESQQVKSITLNDIFIFYDIKQESNIFIKIDCEGAERFILDNPLLKVCQRISIEIHERNSLVKNLCDSWFSRILESHTIIKGKRYIGKNYEIIFQKK
jgi:FkbM family methyltransferase